MNLFNSSHLVFIIIISHFGPYYLSFIFVTSCVFLVFFFICIIIFIKLRNQGFKIFVFVSFCVVVSIKVSSRSIVCANLQFFSSALCSSLHLHCLHLCLGVHLHRILVIILCKLFVHIILFIFNYLCFRFGVCTLLFVFVVWFMFCNLSFKLVILMFVFCVSHYVVRASHFVVLILLSKLPTLLFMFHNSILLKHSIV
jgi:hypothetical protein